MPRERPPRAPANELDELLRPTVSAEPSVRGGRRPWRLGSQFYVAFFGGAAGAAIIAVLNAARLGLPSAQRWAIAGLGLAGLLASAIVISAIGLGDDGDNSTVRIAGRVVGVVAWGGMYLIQRSADRIHDYRSPQDDPYDSMWVPGVLAAVAGGLVQLAIAGAVLGEVA